MNWPSAPGIAEPSGDRSRGSSSHSPVEPRQDPEIIAAVLSGETEAYTELVDRYRDRCNRFAVRFLGDRDDADEALQSAFLRAFRGLGGFRDMGRFDAWLFRIVVNECRTFATRRAHRSQRFVRDATLLAQASVEHSADRAALLAEIQHAVDQLEVDQRQAFLLKHVEELSYEEMSEITGVGISALKMRVQRACSHLRTLLGTVHD
jgi:RNA polymerase sigma-70 factor, ECF subfamily